MFVCVCVFVAASPLGLRLLVYSSLVVYSMQREDEFENETKRNSLRRNARMYKRREEKKN